MRQFNIENTLCNIVRNNNYYPTCQHDNIEEKVINYLSKKVAKKQIKMIFGKEHFDVNEGQVLATVGWLAQIAETGTEVINKTLSRMTEEKKILVENRKFGMIITIAQPDKNYATA